MKKTRKIISILLCAAVAAGMLALAGCTKKSDTSAASASGTKKVWKVGTECAAAPYNWTQKDDSNGAVKISGSNEYANGYDIMMVKKIADSMGYELQIVKTEWAGLPTGVTSGKIDSAVSGMSITSDRLKTLDFSDVYYKATINALVKKGGKFENAKSIADLKGASCTSQQDTTWYELLKQIPDAKILPALADVPTMVVALKSGKCDVVFTDKPGAMAATYSNKDLIMVDLANDKDLKVSDEDVNLGIALKKGNTELKSKIDQALKGISQEEREKFMKDAIEKQPLAQ